MTSHNLECSDLPGTQMVSFAELKKMASELLPLSSITRKIIASEPNLFSKEQSVAKIEILSRLLYEELSEGAVIQGVRL